MVKNVNELILGTPGGQIGAEPVPVPIDLIPEVLRPFWAFVHAAGIPTYRHTIESKYCKVEEIVPNSEWNIGFEDIDEASIRTPDWDFDEPLLHIVRSGDYLIVTMRLYGGWWYSDIYYGETLLFKEAGGFFGRHVGSTKSIGTGAVPPPPPPPTPIPTILPWIVGAALFGGIVYTAAKKK